MKFGGFVYLQPWWCGKTQRPQQLILLSLRQSYQQGVLNKFTFNLVHISALTTAQREPRVWSQVFSTIPDAKPCAELADKELGHMEDLILFEHQLYITGDNLEHLRWYLVPLCVGTIFAPLSFSKVSQSLSKEIPSRYVQVKTQLFKMKC